MIHTYLLILGISVLIVGITEMTLPNKAFAFWEKWSGSRLFFLHGIFLIIIGFPLTIYKGPLSTIIMIIGIIIVLTGPFILLYPEKFKAMFSTISKETDQEGVSKMVYFDGSVRVIVGIILILSYVLK